MGASGGKAPPWNWRILLNGKGDELLYERGFIDRSLPFGELKARSLVNPQAKAAGAPRLISRSSSAWNFRRCSLNLSRKVPLSISHDEGSGSSCAGRRARLYNRFDLASACSCLRGSSKRLVMVRDTGFEPVTPTVSR